MSMTKRLFEEVQEKRRSDEDKYWDVVMKMFKEVEEAKEAYYDHFKEER